MKYCPLRNDSAGGVYGCLNNDCQFWSKTKQDCLVAMALATYIDKENTVSEEVESLKHQMNLCSLGFPMFFQEKNRNE